jgi:hypothetical protein
MAFVFRNADGSIPRMAGQRRAPDKAAPKMYPRQRRNAILEMKLQDEGSKISG